MKLDAEPLGEEALKSITSFLRIPYWSRKVDPRGTKLLIATTRAYDELYNERRRKAVKSQKPNPNRDFFLAEIYKKLKGPLNVGTLLDGLTPDSNDKKRGRTPAVREKDRYEAFNGYAHHLQGVGMATCRRLGEKKGKGSAPRNAGGGHAPTGGAKFSLPREGIAFRLELADALLVGAEPTVSLKACRNPGSLAQQAMELATVEAVDGGLPAHLWRPPGRIIPHPIVPLGLPGWSTRDQAVEPDEPDDYEKNGTDIADEEKRRVELAGYRFPEPPNACWSVKSFKHGKWTVKGSDYRRFIAYQHLHQKVIWQCHDSVKLRALADIISKNGASEFEPATLKQVTSALDLVRQGEVDSRVSDFGKISDFLKRGEDGEFEESQEECRAGLITVVCGSIDNRNYFLANWRSRNVDEYPDSFGVVPAGSCEYAIDPAARKNLKKDHEKVYDEWSWVEESMFGVFLKEFYEEVNGGPDRKWTEEVDFARFGERLQETFGAVSKDVLLENVRFQMTGASVDLTRRVLELSSLVQANKTIWRAITSTLDKRANYESAIVIPLPLEGQTLRMLESRFVLPPSISIALWRALKIVAPGDQYLREVVPGEFGPSIPEGDFHDAFTNALATGAVVAET